MMFFPWRYVYKSFRDAFHDAFRDAYHLFIIQQTEKVPTKHVLGPTEN